MAANATFALKAGLWFRRVRFAILAPDPRYPRRVQADNPLSDLSEFTQPSLLTSSTMTSALEHLADLKPLMDGYDGDSDRYKLHLPRSFFCGLVFFELQKDDEYSAAILDHSLNGIYLRRFFGGAVLRGQGFDQAETGRLSFGLSITPHEGTVGRNKESLLSPSNIVIGNSKQFSDQQHISPMLHWNRSGFSQFGFDIVSLLQGTYQMGQISSLYGMVGRNVS